jgi:hypothetical protein
VQAVVVEQLIVETDLPSDHSSLSLNSRSEITSMPHNNAPKLKATTTITKSFIAIPLLQK